MMKLKKRPNGIYKENKKHSFNKKGLTKNNKSKKYVTFDGTTISLSRSKSFGSIKSINTDFNSGFWEFIINLNIKIK